MSGYRLATPREHTCPCGKAFTSKNPAARYCGNACRVTYGRFGRTYGVVEPRQYGWTRS